MSLDNSFHMKGNVTRVSCAEAPDGRTVYSLRLAVLITDRDDPLFGKKDFIDVTAYGTGEYDPWGAVERGMDVIIDGEVLPDEQGRQVLVGIAVRRAL